MPKTTNNNAPTSPKPIPIDFSQVTFSLKKIAESINNKTGEIVITTELFMGVDRLNPLKNINIFSTIPKKAQPIIRSQSFLSTFSEGKKKEIIQNKIAAPNTRNNIKP